MADSFKLDLCYNTTFLETQGKKKTIDSTYCVLDSIQMDNVEKKFYFILLLKQNEQILCFGTQNTVLDIHIFVRSSRNE